MLAASSKHASRCVRYMSSISRNVGRRSLSSFVGSEAQTIHPIWQREPTAAIIASRSSPLVDSKRLFSSIPSNFGAPDGPPITNKATILDDVNRALGVSKPPDIEVLLTDHIIYTGHPVSEWLHRHVIRFGHVAIRYTFNGKSIVMNIMGDFSDPETTMVNFFPAEEYIYGTTSKSQQGGVYNRPYVGVRVENVASGAVEAMHAYFEALQKASEVGGGGVGYGGKPGDRPGVRNEGAVRFQLVEAQFSRIARQVPPPLDKLFFKVADAFRGAHQGMQPNPDRELPKDQGPVPFDASHPIGSIQKATHQANKIAENILDDIRGTTYISGNCAQWTSSGLDFVGLIRRPRLFPKAILIELLEDESLTHNRRQNVNVVVYREIEHAVKKHADFKYVKSAFVHPLKPIRNWYYSDPEQFANAIVTVPEGSMTAHAEHKVPTRQPNQLLRVVSGVGVLAPAAIMIGAIDSIGPLGPMGAAAWLGFIWWLH